MQSRAELSFEILVVICSHCKEDAHQELKHFPTVRTLIRSGIKIQCNPPASHFDALPIACAPLRTACV